MTPKILLVGSGITTAVTGLCLSKTLPEVFLVVWDKARGIGGRMSTTRSLSDDNCTVDLGAQYISTTDEIIKKNFEIYEPLLKREVLIPMTCKIAGMKPQKSNVKNFIAPKGSSTIVKHFIQLSKINKIYFQHQIVLISLQENKWLVRTTTGVEDLFDVIVLTMPVPQILQLEGSIQEILLSNPSTFKEKLNSVAYTSKYALGLFYNENVIVESDWDAKYFSDDPIIRFIAIDNKKRQVNCKASSVVVHTTKEYAEKHVGDSISKIQSELMLYLRQCFPHWPEPKAVKCHKWKYSQVSNVYPGAPGYVTLSTDPILIAGGDGFVGSTFDDCLKSAKNISNEIKNLLSKKNL